MVREKKDVNEAALVVVKKIVPADRERVFEAWTNPEIMKHWYVGAKGTAKAVVDLRVGGAYTNEMFIEGKSSCNTNSPSSGESYMHHGEYLEIIRPEKLVFTWNSPSVQNTTVTIDLREVAEGTEITITHQLNSPSDCQGHNQGWNYALETLTQYLA